MDILNALSIKLIVIIKIMNGVFKSCSNLRSKICIQSTDVCTRKNKFLLMATQRMFTSKQSKEKFVKRAENSNSANTTNS